MLCWNLLRLAILQVSCKHPILREAFCEKNILVSQRSHWSPFTILEQHGLWGNFSRNEQATPRWACFFLSLEPLAALGTVRALPYALTWLVDFLLTWSFEQSESSMISGGLFGLCYGNRWPPKMMFLLSVHWFLKAHSSACYMFTETPLWFVKLQLSWCWLFSQALHSKNKTGLMAQKQVIHVHPTWRKLASQNESWKSSNYL